MVFNKSLTEIALHDDEIGQLLRILGYASVPLTAVFPGKDPNHPILLDGLFSASRIQEVMTKAAK